ncbi:MAG: PhoU domain-containing protein [Bacteroidales bacterium]|nr:PhoU domain-containing protein [Bacteroidales bacterium]
MLSTSELSLLQARKEIGEYGAKSFKMFNQARKLFKETEEKKFKKLSEKIAKNEQIMDDLEAEIANYLTSVSEGELSIDGARRVRTLLKISDNIESLADGSYNLSRALNRKHKKKIWFTTNQTDDIFQMFDLVEKNFILTFDMLCDMTQDKVDISEIMETENQIDNFRTLIKKQNNTNLTKNKYTYESSVIYIDIITICEIIGDHLVNIAQAIKFKKEEIISTHDDD